MLKRRCVKCGETKPIDEFCKDIKCKNGIQGECKECRRKYRHTWYLQNRQKYLEQTKDYYEAHKEDMDNYRRSYYKENKDKISKYCRTYREKLAWEVLSHYGGNPPKCVCCGENNILFLTIDHINNNGRQHRRELSKRTDGGSRMIYTWLKNNNFPDGFQVLCYNCNCGKARNNGVCPHIEIVKYYHNT